MTQITTETTEHPWGTILYDCYDGGFVVKQGDNAAEIVGEGFVTGVELSKGWVELGWLDSGGYNPQQTSLLSRKAFDALIEARQESDCVPEVEDFTMEAFDTVALYCRREDMSAVRRLLGAC